MAKRLTDTDKFVKIWYKKLPAPYKLLWEYVLSRCDCAGFWLVEEEVAQARLGNDAKFSINKAVELFNADKQRVFVFHNNEKWFIIDFIKFQYGKLNENSKVHKGVIQRLKENGFLEYYDFNDGEIKGLPNLCQTLTKGFDKPLKRSLDIVIDKDKDKVKDIVKEKLFSFEIEESFKEPFMLWLAYKKERKESYKSDLSLKKCYTRLRNLSGNDPKRAEEIVNFSIAQNYMGLYEPNQSNNTAAAQSDKEKRLEAAANVYASFTEENQRPLFEVPDSRES